MVDRNRRQFLRDISVAGAALSLAGSAAAIPAEDGPARPAKIKPIRNASIVVNGLDPSAMTRDVVAAQRAGGVNVWVGSAASYADAYAFMAKNRDTIVPAFTVGDILDAYKSGRIAHVFEWQAADQVIRDGDEAGPAINQLATHHERGLRICGISFNVANAFGGGCLEPNIPLTRNGRQLVEQIHKLRIVLDVGGHTGEQTSFDALEMSTGVPVVCTHTNMRAISDNPRNASDRLLEAIARTGGVIGITAFSAFHNRGRKDADTVMMPQVGLEKHLDQYDYLKRLVGVDHIGLGPDFIAGRTNVPRNVKDPGRPDRQAEQHIRPNGSIWYISPEVYPGQPWDEQTFVKGFENISKLPNVADGLAARGWSAADIAKVMGENWLRVYRQVWGA